jgi:hypothetical protein
MTKQWTEEQNKARSRALTGREISVETRAAMAASRIHGAANAGTDAWQKTYDDFLKMERLRNELAQQVANGEAPLWMLDPTDERWMRYTVSLPIIDPVALAAAIRSQKLDEHLDEIDAMLSAAV